MQLDSYNSKMSEAKGVGVAGCILVLAGMYFLLLGPEQTIFSVYIICERTREFCGQWQFLVYCLLPIYFSLMIFGGGAVGWVLGSQLYRWFFTERRSVAH